MELRMKILGVDSGAGPGPADVVVVDTLIPAALSGAEAAGVPSVRLMHGTYLLPRAGVPPFGMGLSPARGSLARLRDRAA